MSIVTTSSRKQSRRRPMQPIVIVALTVVIVISIYKLMRDPSPQSPELLVTRPVNVAQSIAIKVSDAPETSEPSNCNLQLSTSDVEASAALMTNTYVKRPGQMLLPDGRIITFKPPEEGKTRRIVTAGRVYDCDSEGNWEDVTPPPVFDNPIENQLIGLSLPDGIFIPGVLLGYDEKSVEQILRKPVIIGDDDSAEIRRKKQAVSEMKKVILDYMDEGGTFEKFVREMSSFAQQERLLKQQGLKKVSDLVNQGQIDEARQYVVELNSALNEQGFSSVKLPKRIEIAILDTNTSTTEEK